VNHRSKQVSTGEAPDLANPPSGCRFHPRCVFAGKRCTSASPPPLQVADNHWARCWLFDEGGVGEPFAGTAHQNGELLVAPQASLVEPGADGGDHWLERRSLSTTVRLQLQHGLAEHGGA